MSVDDRVRGEILTSWRRSTLHGVDPEHVEPPYRDTDVDTHFARVAVPIAQRMAELLVGDRSALALSDASGSVVWRWVSEPMLLGTLDALRVAEGFCFDEQFVGTNGLGTALETGALAVVRGEEHFVSRFHDVTCVAAPVRHPITRRTVGAVNVTCRAEHTNPLLRVVVLKLVDEIQAALLDAASTRERSLLAAFLDARRSTNGAVLTVGEDVVIANAAAVDLGLDHRGIWDEVRQLRGDDTEVHLDGHSARLRLVRDGPTTTGAVLHLAGPAPAQPARVTAPTPGRWERLREQARVLLAAGPLVVRGEPGSGRATLLRAALGPDARELDVREFGAREFGAREFGAACTALVDRVAAHPPTVPLLLRHADLLPGPIAALHGIERLGLTATCTTLVDPALADAASLTVPPLRRRTDEIVGLAQQELHRHGLRLLPDAQAALRRHDWPGNVAELVRVLRDAARRAHDGAVGIDALPPALRAAAGRRALSPLERAEYEVIATVLTECRGNKSAAARELGISRTALYAKIRGYRL